MKILKLIRDILVVGILTVIIAAVIWALSVTVTKIIFFAFALGYLLHMLGLIIISMAIAIVVFYICKWMGIFD